MLTASIMIVYRTTKTKRFKGIDMTKKGSVGIFTAILCIIALFIPTYIAIAAFIAEPAQEYEEKQSQLLSLTLTDPKGSEFVFEADGAGAATVELFSSMMKTAQSVTALPESASNLTPFKLKTVTEAGEGEYSFYFNPKGKSYYMQRNGDELYVFAINDEKCTQFYGTAAAMCLFIDTPAPTLKNAFGEAIVPTSFDWKYRDHSGVFQTAPVHTSSDPSASYTLDGAFTLNYDVVPDYEKVILFNADGTVAYDGLRDGIKAAVDMMNATTFKMKLECTWYEDAERSYQGSAVYEFVANVQASAHFALGENKVEAGQIAVINAKNIQDPSLIKVKFTPALKYNMNDVEIRFCGSGDSYSALVPIPASVFNDNAQTQSSMKYQIDITYGDASYTLNLDVTDRTGITTKKGDATKEDAEKYRTKEALDSFTKLIAELSDKSSSDKLWTNEKFYSYYANKVAFAYSYGKMWELKSGEKYRNELIHYKLKEGKDIYAVNDGVVLSIGENDLLGKYIVVDHGMGLESWYLHLGDISVSIGDKVSYKQAIGKSGATGFLEDKSIGFSMMFTVNGVPVCPYSQKDNGKGLEETGLNFGQTE